MSVRWWLALVFAAIAATTAIVVSEVFTQRAETAFRSRAQELAAGAAVAAAVDIGKLAPEASMSTAVSVIASSRKLALFAVDDHGNLLTAATAHGIAFASVPEREDAISRALLGRRYVNAFERGRVIVVALPLRHATAAGLVVVALRPDLVAEIGILRKEIVPSTLIAILVGALVGLVVAILVTRRLRHTARAARRIEGGDLETPLSSRFPDEFGQLATSVDHMRHRLRDSFRLLEAERDRLRRVFAQLEEGVVAVDGELRVAFANEAAVEILGIDAVRDGDGVPEPWRDISLRDLSAQLLVPGASVTYARVRPDESHAYAIAGIPATGLSGLVTLVVRDITESERRERAEREFVANAAHELRTPIAAVGNAVEVLLSGAAEIPEDRDRFLAIIDRQTGKLRTLVRSLLVLARAQTREKSVRLEPVRLLPVFEEVERELAVAVGVRVEIDCPATLAVLGQPDLVEQIIVNLATNAAKHVLAGSIVLRGVLLPNQQVAIEVADTGPGISTSDQSRVFDRFYSSDEGNRVGFGLGLAIVREVSRALGGIVELESELGKGTTVRAILALAVGSP